MLLQQIGRGYFEVNLSVALILEYESVTKRLLNDLTVGEQDVEDFMDYICSVANAHSIYYIWRPTLRDPKDEMVLEVAVAGGCDAIVTFNKRDFAGASQFGLRLLTPSELLQEVGYLT